MVPPYRERAQLVKHNNNKIKGYKHYIAFGFLIDSRSNLRIRTDIPINNDTVDLDIISISNLNLLNLTRLAQKP